MFESCWTVVIFVVEILLAIAIWYADHRAQKRHRIVEKSIQEMTEAILTFVLLNANNNQDTILLFCLMELMEDASRVNRYRWQTTRFKNQPIRDEIDRLLANPTLSESMHRILCTQRTRIQTYQEHMATMFERSFSKRG